MAITASAVAALSVAASDDALAQRNRNQSASEQTPPAASDGTGQSATTASRKVSVLLEFTIAGDGTTKDIVVVESPDAAFDGPAVEAVARWRYEPKLENGRPLERRVRTRITFVLEE